MTAYTSGAEPTRIAAACGRACIAPGFSNKKPWSIPEKPPKAEHHGFICDPDKDEDLQPKPVAGQTAGENSWY